MAKTGESQMGSVSFLSSCKKESWLFLNSAFKFDLFSGDFLFCFPPCLFTVHFRPVLSPCQAGNTNCISSCLKYIQYNIIQYNKSIFTRSVYIIMLAPLYILGITGFCLTIFHRYNKVYPVIFLNTS